MNHSRSTRINQHIWRNTDWRLSNKEIANILGVTSPAVAYQRRKYASFWDIIHWSRYPDDKIAQAIGVDAETVKKNRQRQFKRK